MTYNYNNSLLGDYLTPSGNNLVVENPIIISSGSINNTIIGNNIASSGNFSSLTVNNTGVSLIGHSHLSSDITNFNSSVSGLLPSVTGTGYISSSFINNIYTLSASGLQPSGNYAASSHTHTSSDVTDFNSSVSGLIPVKNVTGSGYVGVSSVSGVYSVSVSGLQPSGNYSVVGHSHVSSDITDFNSSVSGLLPIKDILAGSGISIGSSSGVYTVTAFGSASSSASSLVTTCHNKTGATIPKMSVVYIDGRHGNLPSIVLAQATNESNSSKTYGITATQISNNSSGSVIVIGLLIDVNTDQFAVAEGSVLYLSPSTAGGLTASKPNAPDHMVSVAKIIRNHVNQGSIEVSIQNGFELQELHNVAVSGVTSGQFLQYNSGSGLWVPSSSGNFSTLLVNGTGVSVNGHSHVSSNIADFNSSVSGLLPTISNSGNNRILTSTGSSTGINAETNLSFSDTELSITATDAIPEVSLITYADGTSRGRINAIRYFNTIENPTIGSGIVTGTTLSLISQVPNISGVLSTVTVIRQQLAGDIIGNINRPTRISFSTSSGAEEALDNTLSLTDEGGLLHDGYMIIDDGLSAPTPITNLGTVSGNVSISYNFDKQIQTLILNGTNTNFIEGSGWPSATSVDVLLEITVTSTTSVTWTIVDDWYNPAPSLLVGKYLVLLRSMGTTIQAHYISKKTN